MNLSKDLEYRQFCVFGNPIAHSKSPLIHNFTFSSFINEIGFLGLYGRYLLTEAKSLRDAFFELKLFGANVTVPFKEEAYNQSDEIKGIAAEINSVNTLLLEDGCLIGYNTDAEGFYQTILPYGFKTALLIGAGGSAKAIAYILRQKGIEVNILNRSKERLKSFEEAGFICWGTQNFEPKPFDIVINATPAGLKDSTLPLDKDLLSKTFLLSKMAYDLIYGIYTPFLCLAKSVGLDAKDGRDMLIEQAVLAFELFCRYKVNRDLIRKRMKSIY
ncbi:shikimate dehydrogenase [Helicobacter sp. 13S00477-4]|uniref:shikimate dehydrogenase n=1 Tax=Helicobacter sp. 13S00477-4 TaxID=1905759 RepID=UPI000BA757FB|nr:shikimate dehydrogenase [Helicobacter sp. 13S00477-4]PAF52225.1 shikimate dehydrogenase [Helicobacter sp. 13S00477-4]